MKDSKPLNYQAAGLREPGESAESAMSPVSMKKLRIFKDHLAETPIVVVLVGTTTFTIDTLPINQAADFIELAAAFKAHDIVLAHIDYELLPQLEMITQIIGARIYVLDEVPDLERTPSEMMAVGGYRHHVDLADYMLLLSHGDADIPNLSAGSDEKDNEDDGE